MTFRTIINIPKRNFMDFEQRFLLLGSCFAENIGQKLLDFRFCGDVNPFGVLYNPMSIADALERLLAQKSFTEYELFLHNELYHSWAHHGSFSCRTATETLEKINKRFETACNHLQGAKLISLTFGSSWVYEYEGKIVANCHKVSNNQFVRRRLSVDEIVERYEKLFNTLFAKNPQLHIILSVSPIRYMRGFLPENQTNKAILLLATEELVARFPQNVSYFPAYEIVLDELRDYRFFADDMLHPSNLAVEYIWQRFSETYFTSATQAQLPIIEQELKRQAHRPLH